MAFAKIPPVLTILQIVAIDIGADYAVGIGFRGRAAEKEYLPCWHCRFMVIIYSGSVWAWNGYLQLVLFMPRF